MAIIGKLSEAEKDLLSFDRLIKQAAAAAHYAVIVDAAAYEECWSLPIERLLPMLNHNVARTLAVFAARRELCLALNASLDALDDEDFPRRAEILPGRTDIAFDGKQFIHVPPVDSEDPAEG